MRRKGMVLSQNKRFSISVKKAFGLFLVPHINSQKLASVKYDFFDDKDDKMKCKYKKRK